MTAQPAQSPIKLADAIRRRDQLTTELMVLDAAIKKAQYYGYSNLTSIKPRLHRSGSAARILTLLEAGPMTRPEIAIAAKCGSNSIGTQVLRLLDRGLVVRFGKNTYGLPPAAK